MSRPLSPRMVRALAQAPASWLTLDAVYIEPAHALRRRGLVLVRDNPHERRGLMRGWQWKVSPAGARERGPR